jgi:hypothetical protein
MISKRDQRTQSPKPFQMKKNHRHHRYHNPAQLRAQQNRTVNKDRSSSSSSSEN